MRKQEIVFLHLHSSMDRLKVIHAVQYSHTTSDLHSSMDRLKDGSINDDVSSPSIFTFQYG